MANHITAAQMFDSPEEALEHYGVKGMKWGVRKKAEPNDEPNPSYSPYQRRRDQNELGTKAVRNINRHLNEGVPYKKAQRKEVLRIKRKALLVVAGAYAALSVVANKDVIAYGISARAETERGRRAASNVFGLPANANSGIPKARQRRGAYQVTSL